jgi:prevent-host-death family protein
MATWQAANAKAKFSALLDAAESEGPQLVHRRKLKFVVATAEEFERRVAEAREFEPNKFFSA